MAKKDKEETGEEGKKKKPIKPLLLVLVLAGVGVKMFVLKDPAATPAQLEAAAKAAEEKLYNSCAEENDLPTLGEMIDSKTSGEGTSKTTAPTPTSAPAVEGSVLTLDQSVTVNLEDGHYLKVGLAFQLKVGLVAETVKKEGLQAKATDRALSTLSKHTMDELAKPDTREKIQQKLSFDTCRDYEGEITRTYFTEFVMQ